MCMGSLAPYTNHHFKKQIPNSLDLEPHTCTNMVILAQALEVLHPTWGSLLCDNLYCKKAWRLFLSVFGGYT
jgi:hypothetical protein